MRARILLSICVAALLFAWWWLHTTRRFEKIDREYTNAGAADFPEEVFFASPVDPQVAGEMLRRVSDGNLTESAVLEFAKDSASKIGTGQEWVEAFLRGYNASPVTLK